MINSSFTQTIKVTKEHTAEYLGSGTLAVFATPAMIALMENTSLKCLSNIPEDSTSVGIAIQTNHIKASAIGSLIHCTAKVTNVDGRKYSFLLEVKDEDGSLIGEGTHERVVVNIEKFMAKLNS
ncbi:MAG: thioesterase family protein [Paludibacter sp.]